MPVSMRDVAALAGVSQRTVSNVVNNYEHVKPATRVRVQNAIDTLKYRPSAAARNLRGGRTGLFALALPEIAAPYFAELANLIQNRASERGLTLLIDQTGGTRERELEVLDGYHGRVTDGLIFSPLTITADDLENRDLDFPTVLLGESVTATDVIHISIDNVAAASVATSHLVGIGRNRIAAIGAVVDLDSSGPAQRRTEGWAAVLRQSGLLGPDELSFVTAGWSPAEGYRVASDIVDRKLDIDAFFCFNDSLALGAIKALVDRGVRVPEDIAVVGWDDIEEASFFAPSLTTISPDKGSIARTAVDLLLSRIDGAPITTTEILSDFTLTVRQSA